MAEQTHAFAAMRDSLSGIERRIDRVDQRIDHLEQRVDRFEQRVDTRFDTLEDKIGRDFLWIVGIQITSLVAVFAALLSRG